MKKDGLSAAGFANFDNGTLTGFTAISNIGVVVPCSAVPTLRERLRHMIQDKTSYTEQQAQVIGNPENPNAAVEVCLACPACAHSLVVDGELYCKFNKAFLQTRHSNPTA